LQARYLPSSVTSLAASTVPTPVDMS
jgi:hypothetical protein